MKAFDDVITQLENGAQCERCPHRRLLALLHELRSELYPSNGKSAGRNGNGNGNRDVLAPAPPEPAPLEVSPEDTGDGCPAIDEMLDEIERSTALLKGDPLRLDERRST